ncbi:3-hydroxyanthranilate 3,4-dioxygenase [Strongylocentrotus purpuratus]|uniref:3-hydroxyanthranilate 3,4-dioxygenase n=1 Tax=Strongylocentrotus purpuratus TaxID=7668 RepID=A0A7M7RC30_STRPU|nr:3-hydroxyanthranilate 3,4-dioxygenase [Strongylocentrotus purpuratus]|eukprot:XP_787214.3 PREDICTED: 3-hydroxyanthranilate 3,4-dioxygenase [Strongylocentrotus purpuratus]
MSANHIDITNIDEWIEENKKFFLPPVCNKMMYSEGQMKAFFVGGPNVRKDYHIEEGEELFYMKKGDMCLKVVEQNKHRDIHIKEGEIFLLPSCIPHSPQRQADTVGLVLERERDLEEKDGLRYYVDGTLERLYEEWFYCEDLGIQLAPVIKRYFASEQHKTGKPIEGTLPEKPPVTLDTERKLNAPFKLQEWIEKNREEIDSKGSKSLFGDKNQFSVVMWGAGTESGGCEEAEVWLWQLEGKSDVGVGDAKVKKYELNEGECMLIPKGATYMATREKGSLCMVCFQDPRRKKELAKAAGDE